MKTIIWIACSLDPTNVVFDAIAELGRKLATNGTRLIVFGHASENQNHPDFDYIAVPFSVAETGRFYKDFFSNTPLPMSASAIGELIAVDRAWGTRVDDYEAHILCLRALAFWEEAFQIMQPSAILGWGSSAPLSRVFFHLGRRFQRPVLVMERGVLENTLSLSPLGQGALSEFSTSIALVSPSLQDHDTAETWSAIETYYGALKERHYPQINSEPDDETSERLVKDPHPRILYIGSFDQGSCVSFPHHVMGDLHGTWIKRSIDGAQALVHTIEGVSPAASLWIKPHIGSPFTLPEQVGIRSPHYFPQTDIYRLIEECDVCVTLTSTTQFIAILKDKPVITLGNGQLMGREISYEARSPEELSTALSDALARRGWSQRRDQGKALLAAAFQNGHIGTDDEVPTRFKVADLALFLGRFAFFDTHSGQNAESRISDFREFARAAGDAGSDLDPSEIRAWVQLRQQVATLENSALERKVEIEHLRNIIQQRDEELQKLRRIALDARGSGLKEIGKIILSLVEAARGQNSNWQLARENDIALIKSAGIFDAGWYVSHYPDIAKAGVDPLIHYLEYGATEGRSPNADFAYSFSS